MCILIQEELNKALLNAVKRGKTEEVKRLVRTGADVNGKIYLEGKENDIFELPLTVAAAHGHKKTVAALLELGANVNASDSLGPPLWHAVTENYQNTAQTLLASGADANRKCNMITQDTPLFDAARNGEEAMLRCLLAAGADVNAADEDGFSALYSAALGGKTEVMKYLIAAGAKTNKEALDGMTELHIASALNQLIKFGSGQRRLGR